MAKLILGIGGRVEAGETLSAVIYNTGTGTSAITGYSLQWQALVGSSWVDVGTANSLSYSIPSGTSAVGRSYRLVSTAQGSGNESSTSAATAAGTNDSGGARAPTFSGLVASLAVQENAAATLIDTNVTFSDQDNGNYGGGSLLVLNSNALAAGGDGQDLLSVRNAGTGSGLISYNAATREVSYAFASNDVRVIGVVDAALAGNGSDLKIAFNANATKAAIDRLIEHLEFRNNDDSPQAARILTIRVTDPTAASVQQAVVVQVTAVADGPLFQGPAAFTVDENQTTVATLAASDPDREAGVAQGISWSLVAGTGATDNSLFAIDAASGALRFLAAPDFEAGHGPTYSVRVRAADGNGGSAEQVVAVTLSNVNEAPVAQDLALAASEDGPAATAANAFSDPDAGDSLAVSLDTTGTVGVVTLQGNGFSWDAAGRFEALDQGETATDSFSYTVTDAGGLAVTRTVTVTVTGANDAPVFQGPAAFTVDENQTAVATLAASDPDGASHGITWSLVAGTGAADNALFGIDAATGTLSFLAAPDFEGAHGPAYSVRVRASDGGGGSVEQVVAVTLSNVNEAPVAQDLALAASEDGPAATAANAFSDPDAGDSLAVSLDTAGTVGVVTLQGNGFSWDAAGRFEALAEGETATDSFLYTVTDAAGLAVTRGVTVTVTGNNDAPLIAQGDAHAIVVEAGVDGPGQPLASGSFSASDTDSGDTLTWVDGAFTSQLGTLTVHADGTWDYVLDNSTPMTQSRKPNVPGTDLFVVGVTDSLGAYDTRMVEITVQGQNDAPVPGGDVASRQGTVVEAGASTAGTSSASGQLQATDPDGPTQTASLAWSGGGAGSYGSLALTSSGAWTYTLDNDLAATQSLTAGQSVLDRFLATVTDTAGASASQWIEVTVQGSNDTPILISEPGAAVGTAVEAGAAPWSDIPVASGQLSATDADAGAELTWSVYFYNGLFGTLAIEPQTGVWTYTLDNDRYITQSQTDGDVYVETFTATVSDDQGASTSQLIQVTVHGHNDAPQVVDGTTEATLLQGVPDGQLVIPPELVAPGMYSIAADATGGFMVLGTSNDPWGQALSRFHADGTLDTAYGTGGRTYVEMGNGYTQVAVDPVGRTVVGGTVWNGSGDFALSRYLADGSLDTAFNGGQPVVIDFAGGYDSINQILFDSAGRMLLAGSVQTTFNGNYMTVVVRLNADGSRDMGFGDGGLIAYTDPDDYTSDERIALDSQDRLLMWGTTDSPALEAVVLRYLPDGDIDSSFGEAGMARFMISSSYADRTADLIVDGSDGFLLGWGRYETNVGFQAMLTRFDAEGAIDESYGDAGTVATGLPKPYGSVFDLALDAQGRTLLATTPYSQASEFLLARLLPDGTTDMSFGNDGVVQTELQNYGLFDRILTAADGRVLLAGHTGEPGYSEHATIARYQADGTPDTTFGGPDPDVVEGWVGASDADGPSPTTWSGSADGIYGAFEISPLGDWTYVLDGDRPATQALGPGEVVTETFQATVADGSGAATLQDFVITIVGAPDAP